MTSEQIQQRINANVEEQAEVLAGSSYDKLARLRELQQGQKQLFALRDAARRAEQGQAPREKIGVGYV
jgi:hypothetical protein